MVGFHETRIALHLCDGKDTIEVPSQRALRYIQGYIFQRLRELN